MNMPLCYSQGDLIKIRPGAKVCSLALLGASLILAPLTASADGEWRASVSVRSEYTDNANRSSTDELSERQDEAQLSAGGEYENSLVDASANYRASQRRFDKGSQENRSQLQGDSRLLIGKPYHPVDLLLSHSRRTILNAPDDVDLLRNNDEREIFSATPSARWRPTRADALIARGTFSVVDYRFSPERNSERTSGSVSWEREVSETDQFSVSAQQMDVSFDSVPLADYKYSAYFAAYSVQLRQLNYRVQLGYNESEPTLGEGLSSPSYQLDAGYSTGLHQWNFSASRFITDNSAGSGNRGEFDGFNPGDSSAGDLDQLERTRTEFTWRTQAVCDRCMFSASIYYQDDDYRVETEDRQEVGFRARHDYRFSERASLNVTLSRRDHNFGQEVERSDYHVDRVRLAYNYDFPRGLGLTLFSMWQDRSSDDPARSYNELSGGAGLSYSF